MDHYTPRCLIKQYTCLPWKLSVSFALSLYLEGFGMKDRTNCGIHFGSTTHPRCLMEKIHMSSLEAFGILSLCLWGVGMKYRFNKPRELCWLATRKHASPHGLLQRLQGSQIAASTWSIDGLRTPTELVDPWLKYYIIISTFLVAKEACVISTHSTAPISI